MRGLIFGAESVSEKTNASMSVSNLGNFERPLNESVHLIDLIEQKMKNNEQFYSFELISVKDEEEYKRFFAQTKKFSPLFHAMTWHCGENVNRIDMENIMPLKIAEQFPCNTLLHLAARGLKTNTVESILERALEQGIKNIFALRGDLSSTVQESGDFVYAADLVAFMRKRFDSTFCICVAGYPQMHPSSPSKEQDLFHLKVKVEAGADFIISQMFFEARVFIEFVKDCRKIDIKVPIIPGIFPILDYRSLMKMSTICKLEIPKFILEALETMKDNDEEIRKFGTKFTSRMIREIFESEAAIGFHLFTLNRPSVISNLCGLSFSTVSS